MRTVASMFFALALISVLPSDSQATKITRIVTYASTVSTDASGPLHLTAEINYDTARRSPIAVVMHGYSPVTGNFDQVRANAQRLRDAGFFSISVAMRGRDGSDGIRDTSGVEIYDIYDAVEFIKTSQYATYVDPGNVHITGYSGGGGDVMAAMTRFPDYFRVGSSFFGIADYGYNRTSGWYFDGAQASHQQQMRIDIGDPAGGDPLILDRYAARASDLASQNNPYSEIHLFVNYNEPVCPSINDTSYRDNAIAHADYPGQFSNITAHIGGYNQYVDFNGNGLNDPGEAQNWPHGFPTADQQNAAESWYRSRLLSGAIPQPVLNDTDDLHICGFIKTKKFSLWLGDGQNAAGQLNYSLSTASKTFQLSVLTSDKTLKGKLTVQMDKLAGHLTVAKVNGAEVDRFIASSVYQYNLADGDVLELCLAGDATLDGHVDLYDYAAISHNLSALTEPEETGSDTAIIDLVENWLVQIN